MQLSRRQLLERSSLLSLAAASPPWVAGRRGQPGGAWRVVEQEVAQQAEQGAQDLPSPSPRVARFERLAFGMFVHWGLYSQLAAGEWAMNAQGLASEPYMELMKSFTAEGFDGRALARLAKRAGMGYITLTSRHHDGFSLYDTRGLSAHDVTHTPAGRDLVLDFVEGCRAEGIVPMLYCTTLDWTDARFDADFPAYQQYLRDSIEVLATQYGELGGFWFDGNWSRPDADWELDRLYGVVRAHQPQAMILNNTGIDAGGRVGHPEIDSVTFERGRPEALDRRGHPKYVAGEMCHTLNFHWGIAEKDFNYLSPAHVIEELCNCRRAGANLLLNIGPDAAGRVPALEAAILGRVGDWIDLHGGSQGPVYQGLPSGIVGDQRDFGLRLEDDVYLFVFDLTPTADTRAHPPAGTVRGPGARVFQGLAGDYTKAVWLDNGEALQVEMEPGSGRVTLQATAYPYGTNTVVRVARLSS